MAVPKRYFCCICHEELKEYKPIRLTKALYGVGNNGGHYPVEHYDFCKKHYKVFENWLNKHKKVL